MPATALRDARRGGARRRRARRADRRSLHACRYVPPRRRVISAKSRPNLGLISGRSRACRGLISRISRADLAGLVGAIAERSSVTHSVAALANAAPSAVLYFVYFGALIAAPAVWMGTLLVLWLAPLTTKTQARSRGRYRQDRPRSRWDRSVGERSVIKHGNETPSHQARLLGLAEVAFGWSLHDVMFLTLFTATPQLPTYVQYLLRQVLTRPRGA